MLVLRKLAKEILEGDWQSYLDAEISKKCKFYEEDIIQALLIGTSKISWLERQSYIRTYVPKICNWAVCDLFCSTLKEGQKYQQEYWQLLVPYFESSDAYELRFVSVMLLTYFTNDTYAKDALIILQNIRHDDYYVKMGVAWAISIFYIKQPKLTLALLQDNPLDDFTHNKAIQKIRESFRVSVKEKEMLKTLKRTT